MESQVVRERVKIIAGHLGSAAAAAATQDISAIAIHISPMSCSNSLNNVTRRYDNRLFFARQSSQAKGCFTRQGSSELDSNNVLNSVSRRYDNRTLFARQGSDAQGFFMRQYYGQPANQPTGAPDVLPSLPGVGRLESLVESCGYSEAEDMAPQYARPDRAVRGDSDNYTEDTSDSCRSDGSKWSPRLDVVESGCSYLVMIELPGVPIDNIRVEVSDQNLTVTGSRSILQGANVSISEFRKKEISEGPYQVIWCLPTDVNKDRVSADFAHGLLRITLPKQ